MLTARTTSLADNLKKLYYSEKCKGLLFHGWHHIYLVSQKSVEFADEFPAVNKELLQAAALTHDLNYVIETNTEPEVGKELRQQYLSEAGFNAEEQEEIESMIMEEHTATRHANISDAAKALSDADSLFKIMPITPVILASHYIVENKVDLQKWADKIIREQKPLMDQGIYFYTKQANEKYLAWAEVDLALVQMVKESLDDPTIKEMLDIAYELKVI
jgi:uncharacterized protein